MPLSDVEPRLDTADPSAHFSAYLDYYRGAIELLTHVVHMERRWFVWGYLGEQVDGPWRDHADGDPHGRWSVPDGVGLDDLVAALHAGGERTREILATSDL